MFDEALLSRIETEVRKAEATTSVELVVVLTAASGSYRDVHVSCGAGAAAVMLGLLVYAPWTVSPHALLPECLVAFALGVAAARRWPAVRRLVTSRRRRREQALAGARLAFVNHAVSSTRGRTGVLLYKTPHEDTLEVLPDLAVQAHVPGARLNEVVHRFGSRSASLADRLAEAVAGVSAAVKEQFPPTDSNPDELPDRPKVDEEQA